MKNKIKKIIPKKLLPVAKSFNLALSQARKKAFTKEVDSSLYGGVLKCKFGYNKYGGYCVPLSSCFRPAAVKILAGDVYEPKTIEYILENCSGGDVVHAGTYFGDFLPALSTKIDGDAKVWAFEPNKESYKCAKITIEMNSIENIVIINAGLGKEKELLQVKVLDDGGVPLGGGSKIVNSDSGVEGYTEPVQIYSVDDIVGNDRSISIIQLDVEGHEKQALIGALKTITRCRPIIILEVLPDSLLLQSEWFELNIINLGYEKKMDIEGNSVFVQS